VTKVADDAVAAIRAGRVVVLPTDTVYGLVADGYRDQPAQQLYRLKGRPLSMPSALMAAQIEVLLEALPEVRGRAATAARALLPGQLTLVLPNPARRFGWLCGRDQRSIGVRVPNLAGDALRIVEEAGLLVSTSANLHGGTDPRSLADVPDAILSAAGAVIDGGELQGIASTVIDLTGQEPVVLREGAISSAQVLSQLHAIV
jgi:tRNA threonylcarbamoyl adenosine modification protein (Sua5/YciO/YrdC/YwlC family)